MRRIAVFLAPLCLIALVLAGIFAFNPFSAASAHAAKASSHTVLYRGMPRLRANSTASSTNWSAYAVTGGSGAFTDAKGSWVQPAVTCSRRQTAYSSFWVGLDGANSNSVEQLGTDSDCSRGTPTYYAWWRCSPTRR